MERPPSFESKESNPITPESVMAEIRSRFPDSRALYSHIKEMSHKNYAQRFAKPSNSQEAAEAVLHRLASKRRGGRLLFEHISRDGNETITTGEQLNDTYNSGVLLGLMTAAVYYGEATFISKDGEVLSEPVSI